MEINIAPDKLKHSFSGIFLCLVYVLCYLLGISVLYGLISCVAVAFGWEIYQKITKTGQFEVMDALFTLIAPVIMYFILLIQ